MNRLNVEPVYLKNKELDNLKKIGFGKDANVYKADSGLLYKIYHKKRLPQSSILKNGIYDNDGIRIDKPKQPVNYEINHLEYIDKDSVKLFSSSAINGAIKKQENVFNTYLPLAPIYVDNHFSGCVLKYHKGHFDIHNIRILPKSARLKILKQVLINVNELINNNIYHLDLNNKKIDTAGHSNILISKLGKVQIIDIDGRSAVYHEKRSEIYENYSINNCASLFYELLFDLDIPIDMLDEDRNHLNFVLKNNNLETEFINNFLDEKYTPESLNDFIEYMVKTKK